MRRQTVIPLVTRTSKALSGWLGGGLHLRPDLDQLDALAPDREPPSRHPAPRQRRGEFVFALRRRA